MSQTTASADQKLHRVFVTTAVAIFFITWLKGFRFPNLWGATHFAFNYSQGFVRRGLVGEIARRIGGDSVFRYNTFVVFAFTVFFIVTACLVLAIRRALLSDPRDLGLKVAVLVFGASPGLVFFVHSVGYNDYIGILLVLVALLALCRLRSRYAIFYWVAITSVVSALVHEGLAIMFGPILIFAMACHILRLATASPLSGRTWLLLLTHAAVTSGFLLSLSSIISTIGVEDLGRVQALERHVIAHTDYPTRTHAFIALQRSSKENLLRLMPWYWSEKGHYPGAIQSWQAFAPSFVWMLVYGTSAVRRAPVLRPMRWVLTLLFWVASLAPLAFNFIGWDWGRWNGLALLASFSALLALKLYFPSRAADSSSPMLLGVGLVVAALGLSSTTPLFDNFDVQFFPFTAHQQLIERLIEDGFQYRPRS